MDTKQLEFLRALEEQVFNEYASLPDESEFKRDALGELSDITNSLVDAVTVWNKEHEF